MPRFGVFAFIGNERTWSKRLTEWRSIAPEVPGPVDIAYYPRLSPADLHALRPSLGVVVDGCINSTLAVAEAARVRAIGVPVGLVTSRLLVSSILVHAGISACLAPPWHQAALVGFFAALYDARPSASGTRLAVGRREVLAPGVELDRVRRTLFLDGREESLPAQKFELLCYFVDHAGIAISAMELVRCGLLRPSQTLRLKGLIQELRQRLGPARHLLKAVSGYGYRFDVLHEEIDQSALSLPVQSGRRDS